MTRSRELHMAGFDSRCDGCGAWIWEDDEFGWVDGVVVCAECWNEAY